jgi:hypothetical protein
VVCIAIVVFSRDLCYVATPVILCLQCVHILFYSFSSNDNKHVRDTIVQEVKDQPECKFDEANIIRKLN